MDRIPSPKTYLAQLRERLEKGGASTRIAAQGLTVANPKPLRLELSGESSELSSSSSSGSELSDLERRLWLGDGRTVAGRKAPRGGVGREKGEIMASLNKINSQLGQLLGRMHQPLPSYPPPLPTPMPLSSYPPPLPAVAPLTEHRSLLPPSAVTRSGLASVV